MLGFKQYSIATVYHKVQFTTSLHIVAYCMYVCMYICMYMDKKMQKL